jgi:hypothetical protein
MVVRLTAVMLVAFACLLPPGFATAADSPASVVTAFYKKRLSLNLSGAPTPQQLQALAPYLSQHLQALFAEGDLFSSLFEGPGSFEIATSETLVHEYAVTVHFKYDKTQWKDVVRLATKQGHLVIVDIEYGGDWAFAAKGTLVSALDEGMMTHE